MPFDKISSSASAMLLLLGLFSCSSNAPSPAGSTFLPEQPMVAEFTDFTEPAASDGSLRFAETPEGTLWVTFDVHGAAGAGASTFGFGDDLSRARVADLVAGRLVETTGVNTGVFQTIGFKRSDGVEVHRPVLSLRLSMQSESSVQIVMQLGAALVHEGALPADLPPTATLIVSGQLRLSCTTHHPTIGGQLDPAFSSPFCSQLRAELGLDALLAISNSI